MQSFPGRAGHAATVALGVCLFVSTGCPTGDLPAGPLTWGAHIESVEAVVSERIGTVVTLHWTTVGPTQGYVEYGEDAEYGQTRQFPGVPDRTHALPLMGLRAGLEYHYRLVVTVEGVPATQTTGTFETSTLPPDVLAADIYSELLHENLSPGGYTAFPLISTSSLPLIVDDHGEPVWWHVDDDPHELITGVALAPDGQSVFYNSIHFDDGGVPDEDERIVQVSLDGSQVTYLETPRHSHSFEVLEDGTVAYLAYESRTVDDEQVRGDQIVEHHPDGSAEVVWSVWDHFEYDPEAEYDAGTGWTHANALDYEPDEGAYYVSLRNYSCIVKIDRATGEVVWRLGSDESDFDFVVGSPFAEQHEFDRLDDGIVVFDNGDQDEMESRVIEYELDEDTGEASARWAHVANPVIYVSMGGDVTRFPDGNTMITWSSAGRLDLIDPDGVLVWGLTTGLGTAIGFTSWYPSLYVD